MQGSGCRVQDYHDYVEGVVAAELKRSVERLSHLSENGSNVIFLPPGRGVSLSAACKGGEVECFSDLEKGIQTPMAQGRSTKIISMIRWIRTSRLSMKNSLSPSGEWLRLQSFCPLEEG